MRNEEELATRRATLLTKTTRRKNKKKKKKMMMMMVKAFAAALPVLLLVATNSRAGPASVRGATAVAKDVTPTRQLLSATAGLIGLTTAALAEAGAMNARKRSGETFGQELVQSFGKALRATRPSGAPAPGAVGVETDKPNTSRNQRQLSHETFGMDIVAGLGLGELLHAGRRFEDTTHIAFPRYLGVGW